MLEFKSKILCIVNKRIYPEGILPLCQCKTLSSRCEAAIFIGFSLVLMKSLILSLSLNCALVVSELWDSGRKSFQDLWSTSFI